MSAQRLRTAGRLLQWVIVAVLLAWAVRGIPLDDVGRVLNRLGFAQLAVLLALNALILWSFSWRWWAVLSALGCAIPTRHLTGYRLAAFAISYLTPGPQFGGEPLQVYLLSRRHGVPTPVAIASVVLDKTLELISNFAFLIVGLIVILRLDLIPIGVQAPLIVLSIALVLLPVIYLALSCRGVRPATWFLGRFPAAGTLWPGFTRLAGFVSDAETQVGALCRTQAGWLLAAVALTAISWLMVLLGAWAAMGFLGIPLDPLEAIGVVAAGRLAFLLPIPGGLGALEASQVLAVTALGFSRADGLGLGLLLRARDLVVVGIGAWLALSLAPEGRKVVAPRPDAEEL
jgi:uncharacterized protein (TIRG00374 family)